CAAIPEMLQTVTLRHVTFSGAGGVRQWPRTSSHPRGDAMSSSAKAEAVLALHRFGMGPRPGSIAAIESDPRGALISDLERSPAAAISASLLPSSAKAFRTVADANARRQAKAMVATKEETARRQQMAEAAPMAEGTTPGMSATAEKMAAEAIPYPGRPI